MASVLIVIWFTIDELDQQKYFLTVVFAVILVALSDVGGICGAGWWGCPSMQWLVRHCPDGPAFGVLLALWGRRHPGPMNLLEVRVQTRIAAVPVGSVGTSFLPDQALEPRQFQSFRPALAHRHVRLNVRGIVVR